MKRFMTLLTATIVTVTLLSASATAQQRYFLRNNGWFNNNYLNGTFARSQFRFNQNGPVRRTVNAVSNFSFTKRMPNYGVGNGSLASGISNVTRRNVNAATRVSRRAYNDSSQFARQTIRSGQQAVATVLGN